MEPAIPPPEVPSAGQPNAAPAAAPPPAAGAPPANPYLERLTALGFTDLEDLMMTVELEARRAMSNPNPPAAPAPSSPPPAAAVVTPPLSAAPPPAAPASPAQVAAAAADDPANDRRLPEALRRRVAAVRDQARQRAEAAETLANTRGERVTALEGEIQAIRAAETLKISMVQQGIKEIEFAWHLLSGELARLKADPSPEAKEKLKTFDVAAWAAELRKTKSYLFGEQVVPATSPGPGSPAGAAPTPAAVTGAVAGAGTFDARTAPSDAFRKRMEELGVRYTGAGAPMRR